jgi:hypothetical protein
VFFVKPHALPNHVFHTHILRLPLQLLTKTSGESAECQFIIVPSVLEQFTHVHGGKKLFPDCWQKAILILCLQI